MPRHLLLFDGDCGLCHRSVRFVLKNDPEHVLAFARLGGSTCASVEQRSGLNLSAADSVVVVLDFGSPSERVLVRSDATVALLKALPAKAWLGKSLGVCPKPIRELGYKLVAKNRLRYFGRADLCSLPTIHTKDLFLE